MRRLERMCVLHEPHTEGRTCVGTEAADDADVGSRMNHGEEMKFYKKAPSKLA
jgi:hypothetical protein